MPNIFKNLNIQTQHFQNTDTIKYKVKKKKNPYIKLI